MTLPLFRYILSELDTTRGIEWGIDRLLELIDGMYAICIYDKAKELIYLVRDRVGIKPLYYSSIGNQIVWGSELKAIKAFYSDRKLEIG